MIPFKQEARPFSHGLRSEVFSAHRSPADWWCVLDARSAVARNGINFQHETRERWRNTVREVHGAQYAERTSQDGRQSWQERVVPASHLQFDAHDGNLIANEAALPPIRPDPPRPGALRSLMAKARMGRMTA